MKAVLALLPKPFFFPAEKEFGEKAFEGKKRSGNTVNKTE